MSAIDPWTEFEFLDGVVGYFAGATGVDAFFFVFLGATFLALYQASGSVMLPVVVLIILAPMIAALIPAVGIQFVTVVLLAMLTVGGYWLFRAVDI